MSDLPRLADADAARLSAIFREVFGWEMPPESRTALELRLRRRLTELSLASFSEHVWFLTYDRRRADELLHVADLLTTRETYFFREQYQLRAFAEEILPAIAANRTTPGKLRVWSAGCASGEEAYTLAILASESRAMTGWDCEIFGSDISPAALAAARRGEYDDAALRQMPLATRDRWFQSKEGRWSVDDRLRARVRFGAFNLAADANPPGPFDVIVCRNVTIYFSGAAKKRLARQLWESLHPGGWLLLGHAESFVSVTSDFELVTLKNDLVYRRPAS